MSQVAGEGLGERVAKYRKMNGWSARELAEIAGAGLTRDILAKMESGKRPDISVRHLFALATALQVPPVALVFDIEKPFEDTDIELLSEPVRDPDNGENPVRLYPYPVIRAAYWMGGQEMAYNAFWPPARLNVRAIMETARQLHDLKWTNARLRHAIRTRPRIKPASIPDGDWEAFLADLDEDQVTIDRNRATMDLLEERLRELGADPTDG